MNRLNLSTVTTELKFVKKKYPRIEIFDFPHEVLRTVEYGSYNKDLLTLKYNF
jgi:hypothetical protein